MMDNEVNETILFDEDYFTSLIRDIENATSSIFLETYIYDNDKAGKILADVLCTASKRGVDIRVLVDGVGSINWGNGITHQLQDANIKTRIYHPLPWFFSHWRYAAHSPTSLVNKIFYLFTKINSRNHRKTSLIDKKIIYIGSANITDHLISENTKEKWRETSIRIADIPTEEIEYAQEKAWGHIAFKRQIRHFFIRHKKEKSIFRLNTSRNKRMVNYYALINKLSICRKRIWVTNAYFTPDSLLLRMLKKAGKRGIDVRILLPHTSDVIVSSLAANTFYSVLLKNGIKIYEYLPSMLHAKSMIIDDWYLLGSSNLDFRSLRHDLEVDVIIQTESAKKILEEKFKEDLEHSKKITLSDVKKIPYYKLLLGYLLLRMKYIL